MSRFIVCKDNLTDERIREWVEGQFYADVEDKVLCEDYENFEEAHINNLIEVMYNSLLYLIEVEE